MRRYAEISLCGTYRWSLERDWSESTKEKSVLFVLNNPSIADAEKDDPTARRGMGYVRSWGYNCMLFANTNPWRSTDPKFALLPGKDVMDENDTVIDRLARRATIRIAAWGTRADYALAVRAWRIMLLAGPVHVLALSKDGTPKHPLYLCGDLAPQLWSGYANI